MRHGAGMKSQLTAGDRRKLAAAGLPGEEALAFAPEEAIQRAQLGPPGERPGRPRAAGLLVTHRWGSHRTPYTPAEDPLGPLQIGGAP